MRLSIKSAVLGGIIAVALAQPALAQTRRPAAGAAAPAAAPAASSGPIVPGLAIADFEAILVNTDANRAAATQRQTTYKSQIDAYEARRTQLAAQLKPYVDKFEADRRAANPNQASLQQQAATIQQLQERGQQELNTLAQPIAYSQAYVAEQIEGKLDAAVRAAMARRRISILLNPSAVVAVNNNAYNLNPDILAEVNRALPTAQVVPPQGWEPRQIREARAQQQQAGAAPGAAPAAPARPAGPQPDGR